MTEDTRPAYPSAGLGGLNDPLMVDRAAKAANPNGTPVIPPAAVPYVLAGAGVLTIVGEELSDPAPWSAARVIGLVTKLVGYLALGASPGLRRRS